MAAGGAAGFSTAGTAGAAAAGAAGASAGGAVAAGGGAGASDWEHAMARASASASTARAAAAVRVCGLMGSPPVRADVSAPRHACRLLVLRGSVRLWARRNRRSLRPVASRAACSVSVRSWTSGAPPLATSSISSSVGGLVRRAGSSLSLRIVSPPMSQRLSRWRRSLLGDSFSRCKCLMKGRSTAVRWRPIGSSSSSPAQLCGHSRR